jgi:hypothetical protein
VAGPSAAGEALRWAREALGGGRYWVVDHARDRQRQRQRGWRVTGPSLDEIATAIGVEVYVDHLGKRLIVVTVF